VRKRIAQLQAGTGDDEDAEEKKVSAPPPLHVAR
jgi:hypothetical protein